MKRILKAKEEYNATLIPPELESVVNNAIRTANTRKGKVLSIIKGLAPVAACAVICIVIGISGGFDNFFHGRDVASESNDVVAAHGRALTAQTEVANVPLSIVSDTSSKLLPFDEPLKMYYHSGVGAWGTELTLANDGTFSGYFSDENAGEVGDDYEYGTVYECSFNGSFSEITKIDDFTYSLRLTELNIENEGKVDRIENEVRYVESKPYGLLSEAFIFTLPGKASSALTEDQRFFWRVVAFLYDEIAPDTLSCYALLNNEEDMGFFTENLK